MAPISLKIVVDDGSITKKVKLDPSITAREAHAIVRDKTNLENEATYGLFLRSPDNALSGVWLEEHRALSYYMLRDGDRLDYINKVRNLRVKMLDDSVKTIQVDQSKAVADLMITICGKLGITNHEEYGLCLEPEDEPEETKAGHSGTLTLKKKTQLKERDLQFEQLSKKLKTDDNVEWIDAHKTLSEACISPQRTVVLMRRLFYSDRNVDSRDPVSLNLLYVQARDNILDARHPVTENQAVEFAGIQCQIHFGDFQEDKHKSGFIENMREYMPETYMSGWGIEKKVLKEYSKHPGLSALDAKHLYTKTARALPTYGVTFFLVKEKQKDKKKLVPRLLGINAESILRLDETTKEILQTWPLTHVKTYHASKGEIFTLNFGDYSDKEYSVKTRDAYRIRDILEDYIDLIRKRMMAQYNSHGADSAYITQDSVQSSTANIVQHMSTTRMKIVDESLVGPSSIITTETGSQACQGAQIVSVQDVIISNRGQPTQQAVKTEVGMRGDMSIPFTRRLNRLNSNSVKIVTLLTDPTDTHVQDARKIIDEMNADMPYIKEGVQETIMKQTSADEKKKLQDQMDELEDLMNQLNENTKPGSTDASEAADAAMRVADLTTQMYFALDAKTKRRSQLVSRSRNSFVEDERTQKTIRKASMIAASSTALHAVQENKKLLDKEYTGPGVDARRCAELEAAAVDKLGRLNAAVAHYIFAHSEPENIDYDSLISSMNTINEIIPEFAKDVQAIASTKGPQAKDSILLDAKNLCDVIKRICESSSVSDKEKLEAGVKDFTDTSGRLVFVFGKGKHYAKVNEMLDLADEAARQTSNLLMSVQELTQTADDEAAVAELDSAGVHTANAARNLIDQVQMTAPTISEPHCQSAVSAASSALSASVQRLAVRWKPLVQPPERHQAAENLHHQGMQLARALDRLKAAYSGLGGDEEGDVFDNPTSTQERQRLQFINTVTGNKKQWEAVDGLLAQSSSPSAVTASESEEAQTRLAQRLGQLNAAIASLLAATSDRGHPDYGTAELALCTINELMPQLVEDSKLASANKDAQARAAMLDHIKALCHASNAICDSAGELDPKNRAEALTNFTKASEKLVFGVSHRGDPKKEKQIIKMTEEACQKTSQLVNGAQILSKSLGGNEGLQSKGARCNDAAEALRTTAQVTAHSISEPRCQSAILSSMDKLSSAGQDLAQTWRQLERPKNQVEHLEVTLDELEDQLSELKGVCGKDDSPKHNEEQKLQFVKTLSGVEEQMQKVQKALNKPIPPPQSSDKAAATQLKLSGRLGELNAAIAALLAATSGERPDYKEAEEAANKISKIMPYVVQDTQSTCANQDGANRAAMLDNLKKLCEASRIVCANSDGNNPKELADAASKFADASGKLVYVINPRANGHREKQIVGLTAEAGNTVSQLLAAVEDMSKHAPAHTRTELDARAADVAGAARALRATQVLAPTISEPHSKATMLSSIGNLSCSTDRLSDSVHQACQESRIPDGDLPQFDALNQQLKKQLEALKKACDLPDNDVNTSQTKGGSSDPQKMQFVKTMSNARELIENAQKGINKPLPPPHSSENAEAVEHRLSGRLSELNAAIAALLNATADRRNPDYKEAEEAIKTITELLPGVIQDTQSSCANQDKVKRAAMLELLNELCEGGAGACAPHARQEDLDAAVTKFSNASGKLIYRLNPHKTSAKEKQILELTSGACEKARVLQSSVQNLPTYLDKMNEDLEARGRNVDDAAHALLATAKLTASTISAPHCKQTMISSADSLSSSAQDLVSAWQPVLHETSLNTLRQPLQLLEAKIEELKTACCMPDNEQDTTAKQQKLSFGKSMSAAQQELQRAHKLLEQPLPPPSGEKAALVQHRLAGRLGELNAAIAALLAATADRERPNYVAAEDAAKTITELMPHIVQDTQSSCANQDAAKRAAMLDLIKELCEASRAVCAKSDENNTQGLSDAVSKFSDASGKLVYVVNPRVDEKREKQILSLVAGSCGSVSELLAGVEQVSKSAAPARGEELDSRGAAVADAAQGLLGTAQITAASISEPHCQTVLLSSIDKLASSNHKLAETWKPLLQDPKVQAKHLEVPHQKLVDNLDNLRKICCVADAEQKQQKLSFGKSMSAAQQEIQRAHKLLEQPLPPPSGEKAALVQHRLAGRLGELNAAIAALLAATADRERPNYVAAEDAAKTITELMPHIVLDTQSSCANQDAAKRAAMLDLIKELCEASRAVCAKSDENNTQGLSDAVSKFSDASGKLVYVVNPRVDEKREKQILSLVAGSCGSVSELLAGVEQVSKSAAPARGEELDSRGAAVADAAQGLLGTAQITAASISEPHCQTVMLSSIDKLASSNHKLAEAWKPLLQDPKVQAKHLEVPHQKLVDNLDSLKKICCVADAGLTKKGPPAPLRSSSVPLGGVQKNIIDATRDFLHKLRLEEDQGHLSQSVKPAVSCKSSVASKQTGSPRPSPPVRDGQGITDDEKRQVQLFIKSVDDAAKSIQKDEDDLKQSSKSYAVGPAISAGECMAKQARLQQNIALVGVEVASLVGANYADKIDYTAATKATQALPQLLSSIVEDGKVLSSTVNEEARRAFMQDMLQMCEAGKKICESAKSDRDSLNDAAIEFGDKSAKVLYIVSNDVDPTLEKEIITRAKAIGDSLSQISVQATSLAAGEDSASVQALCGAGARAQDAAGQLIYTAKLVAPSIYEPSCQQALHKSATKLSTELAAFKDSWEPFSSHPQHAGTVRTLGKEAANLHRILEGLKEDVHGGKIGQLREIQKLVIEDTPMRQLTLKIIDDAKKLSKSSECTPALKSAYRQYEKRVTDALRAADLANARCARAPHDTNKRRELENAIQNLQMLLLQSRPSRGDKERSNIVDLRDFIDEVSAEGDKVAASAAALRVPVFADKKTLENIKSKAEKISKTGYKLTHCDGVEGFNTSFNDILDVDQFGQECDEVIADIEKQIQSIEDAKARTALLCKILPLSESCNMLRFATKSGISTAKSASLDCTLDDLDDIESRVIKNMVQSAQETAGVTLRPKKSVKCEQSECTAALSLSRAASSSPGAVPRAPLAAYIAGAAASADTSDEHTRNQLLKHLYKLVHLLKTQAVAASRRTATWQTIDHPEVAAITDQILQEIHNPESKFRPESEIVKPIINETDFTKLLVPAAAKVVGDNKHQDDILTQLCTKLNSMSCTLSESVAAPESLARSGHEVSKSAIDLSAVARGCKDNKDPAKSERIEEAVQNMTFVTYGLLKTAEKTCREPDNPNMRRRLKEACAGLNEAISGLMHSASSASEVKKECVSASLALQQLTASLQGPPTATSALPFQTCCEQLDIHQETINKLKDDKPMTRQEFAKSLTEVNDAVCKTTAISSQCTYLIAVSESQGAAAAAAGPADAARVEAALRAVQDSCMSVIGAVNVHQAQEETEDFQKRIEDFSRALDDAQLKVQDGGVKATLARAKSGVVTVAAELMDVLKSGEDMEKVTIPAVNLLQQLSRSHSLIEACPLVPSAGNMSAETKSRCDELTNNNKTLINHTLALVKEVNAAGDDDEMMTWVTFNTNKTKLMDAYEALLKSIRVNGKRAGILEGAPEEEVEEDAKNKTYLDIQVDLANKWLQKPMCKAEVKINGQQGAKYVIDIADKMVEDLKGSQREELRNIIPETKELLTQCTDRYDQEKYSLLKDRLKEIKKAIQRGVVTRVVEDFIECSDPLADLDILADSEPDSQKRVFLLERKIAELLAQLGRVTRTARFAADAGSQAVGADIRHCTEQTELLAPMMVQAAQERIAYPDNKAAMDKYQELLAKYTASISKVRDLCDRTVDPMDFVQTAGDTMQRMREDSSLHNDAQKGHITSQAIIRLANRSIDVSMSSHAVRRDPELRAALVAAQRRVLAATPAADCRASRLPDWKESTAEIMRTTGEVESALGGENIFKKQPTAQGTNQQIYTVARDLHECVREWSSRDNEIVAVARRMAVLMARLSEYMETDKKQALLATSKSIVSESHEVAALARKLAHECTDVRIKTNLLQTCERIPTISAQLKMLTTVKSSSLGHRGTKEDTEAMDMLVGNAQSLMLSIQEVVKAAAGASVKIMSQRGPKLRWVRKTYY